VHWEVHRGTERVVTKVTAEDQVQTASKKQAGRATMGATPVVAAEELDPGRERRPLESYFQEIGGTRTLRREEEVILAKELEAATADLRDALYQVPCCARHVVERWDALRALSHTGAKLSESIGSEETGEIAARVARAVKRIRTLRVQRERALEKKAVKELDDLLDGNDIEVAGERIAPEDVVVAREPREGVVVAAEGAVSVALDTELSDELVLEGVAREVINRIQALRREADFAVSDRIVVGWRSPTAAVVAAFEAHASLIAEETLATSLEVAESGSGTEVEISGEPLWLTVERSPGPPVE